MNGYALCDRLAKSVHVWESPEEWLRAIRRPINYCTAALLSLNSDAAGKCHITGTKSRFDVITEPIDGYQSQLQGPLLDHLLPCPGLITLIGFGLARSSRYWSVFILLTENFCGFPHLFSIAFNKELQWDISMYSFKKNIAQLNFMSHLSIFYGHISRFYRSDNNSWFIWSEIH